MYDGEQAACTPLPKRGGVDTAGGGAAGLYIAHCARNIVASGTAHLPQRGKAARPAQGGAAGASVPRRDRPAMRKRRKRAVVARTYDENTASKTLERSSDWNPSVSARSAIGSTSLPMPQRLPCG